MADPRLKTMVPQGPMIAAEQQHRFEVGFWEGAKANFLRNPISMSLMSERMPFRVSEVDDDFDPSIHMEQRYEPIREDIMLSGGIDEVMAHKRNFDMFAENKMVADQADLISTMLGEVGAYAVSPAAWLGLGGTTAIMRAAKLESRMGAKKSLHRIVANTGHGFGTEAAHQALMVHLDDQLSVDEAAMNVFVGTIFGAGITALGVGSAKLYRQLPESKKAQGRKAVLNAINNSEEELSFERQAENDEFNNAHNWTEIEIDGKVYTSPEDMVIDLKADMEEYAEMDGEFDLPFVSTRNEKNKNLADTIVDVPDDHRPAKVALLEKIMDKYIALTTPGMRFAYSVLPETKEIGDLLRRTAILDNKNFHGKPSSQSAESKSDVHHINELNTALRGMVDDYDAYRSEQTGKETPKLLRGVVGVADTLKQRFSKNGIPFMSEGDFVREVSRSLLNGDVHKNKHVAAAAKRIRELTLDPNFERMKRLGMVNEEMLSARFNKSHLPRLWLADVVLKDEGRLVDLIFQWQQENLPPARQKTKKQLTGAVKEIYNDPIGLDRQTDGRSLKKTYKGFFKERTIEMDDNILMDEGFIQTDARIIITNYVHSVRTDMALVENFGSVGLEKQIDQVSRGWKKLREQVRAAGGSDELMEKMLRTEKREIRDIEAVRDIQRGVFAIPEDPYSVKSTALRVALDMNNPIMLGGITVSSFPDIVRTFYANDISESLGDARAMFKNRDIYKIGLKDLHRAGVAMDSMLNMVSLTYMFMDSPAFTKYDRVFKAVSNGFFKATLLPQWNDFIKGVTGIISASKMMDDMVKWVESDSIGISDDSVVYKNEFNNKWTEADKDGRKHYIVGTTRTKKDPDGNEYFEITVDEDYIRKDFVNKPWRDIKGADPLPDEFFRSSTDWVEFIKRHEYWHTLKKQKAGESDKAYENRINQLALGPASRERVRLLSAGIGFEDAKKIVALWRQHGDEIDGVKIANTANWHKGKISDDPVEKSGESNLADEFDDFDLYTDSAHLNDVDLAKEGLPTTEEEFLDYKAKNEEPDFEPEPEDLRIEKLFLAALNREVNNSIVTPGSADKPLWMHNEWGKVIGQYKSFIMAATEKIAVSGLQYRDKRALQAAIVSVMLGSQVSAIKDKLRGSKPPDNVLGAILDGIDQSGITGWGFTVNNAIETLTGNNIGLRPFTGNQNPWTPSMKHIVGTFAGPTAGNLAALASIGSDVVTGSIDNNTGRTGGKFIPGHNLPYVQVFQMARIPDMFDALKGADRF